MKIALAYRRIGRGAAVPNYCWELARGLCQTHETWVFAREADDLPSAVRQVHLPLRFHSRRLEYALNTAINSLAIRLARARERFDIVHTQDGELVGGDIVTAHSLLRLVYQAFRESDPDYVAWIPRNPLLRCEDFVYGARRFRHILAASEKMRLALHHTYGIPESDVSLVRLAVDADVFRPNPSARATFRMKHGIPEETTIALHVSTDFQRKGLDTILRALVLGHKDIVLVVAGRGQESIFRDLARRDGVANRLLFLGYHPNLEQVYPAADIFLFPTQFDFFGYPVLEAMACGLPCFVTRDAGVAELIRDERNGFLLANPRDERELSDSIHAAGDLTSVGQEARRTAQRLSTSEMVRKTAAVYEHLLRR